MPIYEYELCEGDCAVCGGRFTLVRPLSAPPLTHCPACKKPVRKVLSTFNSPRRVSFTDAKRPVFRSSRRLAKASTSGSETGPPVKAR